ncbi:hypothetical protein DPMN_090084 [Dreissena polymorpha]|uniref:Orn/DAP/Arg decarboxylase 2 N-terminal domain-containing protein n=1 Tax=Dreissena polymorpha TaxID=45954 RepID=A0A9D4QYP9_DREPO|nr:hypothetical protein DPMN_090084 [Dreissena polymorpha]
MILQSKQYLFKLRNTKVCIFRLVLRISPQSNFKVLCDLGIKFGVNPEKAINLLRAAKNLGLDIIGVSFHVGSGCQEPEAFASAIQQARMVFDQGRDLGFNMTLLDIGGGFPGHAGASVSFDAVSCVRQFEAQFCAMELCFVLPVS